MSNKIVLISCVSQKLPKRAKVRDLYVSTLFKLNLKYAEMLKPDAIYVLSAKHGLLSLEDEIDPYEVTLNNMKSADIRRWAENVMEQLNSQVNLDNTTVVFLAGDKYRRYLFPHIPSYEIPLQGLRIGEQLQRLKALTS